MEYRIWNKESPWIFVEWNEYSTSLYFSSYMRWRRNRRFRSFVPGLIKLFELPLQGRDKRTGSFSIRLSSTSGRPTGSLPAILYLATSYNCPWHSLDDEPLYFHFRTRSKSTQIYTHGTMERLRSNLSHILRSGREMVMKVFSKFAGSLRRGKLREHWERMAPCPWLFSPWEKPFCFWFQESICHDQKLFCLKPPHCPGVPLLHQV